MSGDDEGLVPIDVTFARLLAKARSMQASREKLEQTSTALHQKQAQEANRIAARFEWKPRTAVALLEEQQCLHCGNVTQLFRGFATEMRRSADSSSRFVIAKGIDEGLPYRRHILHSTSEACVECLPERGI